MKPLLAKSLAAIAITSAVAVVCLVQATAENTSATPTTAPTTTAPEGEHHHHFGGWNRDGGDGKDGAKWGNHGDRGFQGGHRCHGMHDPMQKIEGSLGLTDAQKAQIAPILKAQKDQIEAIRKQERSQIEAVISNSKVQILPFLTPEQQAVMTDKAKLQADEAALRAANAPATPAPAQH